MHFGRRYPLRGTAIRPGISADIRRFSLRGLRGQDVLVDPDLKLVLVQKVGPAPRAATSGQGKQDAGTEVAAGGRGPGGAGTNPFKEIAERQSVQNVT